MTLRLCPQCNRPRAISAPVYAIKKKKIGEASQRLTVTGLEIQDEQRKQGNHSNVKLTRRINKFKSDVLYVEV